MSGSKPTLPGRTGRGWRQRLLAVLLCALAQSAATAHALDAHKTAEALASRAAKAFEAGNMPEAATLYREAYRIDRAESAYLYGAARAAHSGRDLEHAEADYVTFLSLPTADAARVVKAKAFLATLRTERAEQVSAKAEKAEAAGDALLAATLYLEASRMAPDRPDPLLKAAILERQLGDKQAAIGHLQQYLQLAGHDANGRGTAEALLKELDSPPPVLKPTQPVVAPVVLPRQPPAEQPPEQPKPVVEVLKPLPPPERVALKTVVVETVPVKTSSARRTGGWTAIGLGGAVLVGAGVLAFVASSQQSTLDTNLLPDGNFDGRRITVDGARSEQASINGKWTGTAILAGASAAVLGVGIWLIASDRADVTLVPSWDGLHVAGRF